MQNDNEFDFEDEDFISKTQVKAEMLELKELGLEIAALPASIYDSLDISLELRDAIDEYKRIKHKNALKRQASFVGKLMRREDADALKNKLEEIQEANHRATRQLHIVERWRDRLISNEENALADFLDHFPHCDRQQLRSLIRAVEKERAAKKPPASVRKLFKFIQQLVATQGDEG